MRRINPTINTRGAKKQKIMVSPLAMYERAGWYHPDLVTFLLTVGARYGQKWDIVFNPAHQVVPAAGARNLLAKKMQEHGCDWIMMCDNDVAPPPDVLDMLEKATDEMDVVVPVCHMWLAEKAIAMSVMRPVGLQANDFNDLRVELDSLPEWLELEATGTGCIFLRRRVFEKMEYPYFHYKWDSDGCLDSTEDIIFSQESRKKGVRIWLNTKFTARHFHTVDLSTLHFPPPETTSGPPNPPSICSPPQK